MKYLLTLDGDSLDSKVARRFGFAGAHLVFDTESGKAAVHEGGVEDLTRHGLDRFAGLDLAGVITGNIGTHAWRDTQALGLAVFIARGMTGQEALDAVMAGEIVPATEPTVKKSLGHHDHD